MDITLKAKSIKLNEDLICQCSGVAVEKQTHNGKKLNNARGLENNKSFQASFIGEQGEAAAMLNCGLDYTPTFGNFSNSDSQGIDLFHKNDQVGIREVDVKTSLNRYPECFYVSPKHLHDWRYFDFYTNGGDGWLNAVGWLRNEEVKRFPLADIGGRGAPCHVIPTGAVHEFNYEQKYLIVENQYSKEWDDFFNNN